MANDGSNLMTQTEPKDVARAITETFPVSSVELIVRELTWWLHKQASVPLEWQQDNEGHRARAQLGGLYTVIPFEKRGERCPGYAVRHVSGPYLDLKKSLRNEGRLIKRDAE